MTHELTRAKPQALSNNVQHWPLPSFFNMNLHLLGPYEEFLRKSKKVQKWTSFGCFSDLSHTILIALYTQENI